MSKKIDTISLDRPGKKNGGKIIKTIIILALVIVLAIIGIRVYQYMTREFNDFEVIDSTKVNDISMAEYISYDKDKLLRYSRDGITALDASGNDIWSASYNMKKPYVVTRGEYVAVADMGNKQLIIYNGKGEADKVEIVLPISMVDISAQGIAAVVVQDEMTDYIKICDGDEVYSEIKTRIAVDGYPVSISISNDAKKLVTSYAAIGDGETENFLTFYNFGEVGKNYTNRIVRAETLKNVIAPYVRFVNDNAVAVFTEKSIKTYSMKETPAVLFESGDFDYQIKSVLCDNENVGVILDNYKEGTKELRVYSLEGDEKISEKLDCEYTNVYMENQEIVMNSDKGIRIITDSGKVKFDKTVDKMIYGVYSCNSKDKYILIQDNEIMHIKLIETK